jgi:hypothetical protein
MSKSNVNPNHYKVAGRERQGEDITQARHKQKHAESVVRQRTEPGARSRKPPTKKPATKKASPSVQEPAKRAKRSAPKRPISRGGVGVIPPAAAGGGVSGRQLSRRRPKPRT